jgi:hypothetical protein
MNVWEYFLMMTIFRAAPGLFLLIGCDLGFYVEPKAVEEMLS